ncbi:MAG: transglycosylase domain-containing protein [Patescibacteria group bacterium]
MRSSSPTRVLLARPWRLKAWRIFIQRQLKKRLKRDYWVILIRRRPWCFRTFLACLVLLMLLCLGGEFFLLLSRFYTGNIPFTGNLNDDQGQPLNLEKLGQPGLEVASYVLDKNGEPIGRFFYVIRDPIRYEEISAQLANGFIAAEDKRFYSHSGIDRWAIGRAGLIRLGHTVGFKYGQVSGASTITQQLARLLYAEELEEFQNREQNFRRKLKEARVAIQIEKRFSKKRILEGYLNRIYFGHSVNGIAEASRFYFGKDIRKDKLNPREIAILASMNKSPKKYCPIFHEPPKPEVDPGATAEEKEGREKRYRRELAQEMTRVVLAKDRFNWALGRMRDDGYITEKEYLSALFDAHDLIEPGILHITRLNNRYFGYGSRFVKEMLLINGYEDEDLTHYGGLKIRTSFDPEIQKIAMEELNKHLGLLNSEIPEGEEKLEGAFVIIENKTGHILAMSGGHDFSETQFDRALALRSAGSAFKPFTYAAAFEFSGKTFEDKICNCSFTMRGGAPGERWSPRNFREDNPVPSGHIPLPVGLIRSVNLATLNLARSIGIESVIKAAHETGVWGNRGTLRDDEGQIWFKAPGSEVRISDKGLESLLPTAIGASDVSLLELTTAYGVFARGGTYIRPSVIMEIKDWNGEVLYKAPAPEERRALSESTCQKITILMRAVTKVGTAKISMRGIEQQVAVKTGTSNGPRDLSMIGFTPELTVGIRVGHDSNKVIKLPQYMKRASGRADMQVSGGWVVGPLWRKFIDRKYEKRPKVEFPPEIENGLQELLANYPEKYK